MKVFETKQEARKCAQLVAQRFYNALKYAGRLVDESIVRIEDNPDTIPKHLAVIVRGSCCLKCFHSFTDELSLRLATKRNGG